MPLILIAAAIAAGLYVVVATSQASQSSQPTPAAAAAKITQLLLAIQDPSWRDRVQGAMMLDTDPLTLEILAGSLSVGEPAGAQALQIKVAALQGKATYAPPPLPTAVNDPGVYNLFATGQYQGCDVVPSCDPSAAKYGSGAGPMGLDAGIANLEAEGSETLEYLLQAYPDSFAKQFPKSTVIQTDPTSTLAQTISAVEAVVRSSLPMTATALRYKQAFLLGNKTALNAAALAALQTGTPMTSSQVVSSVSAQAPGSGYSTTQQLNMAPANNPALFNAGSPSSPATPSTPATPSPSSPSTPNNLVSTVPYGFAQTPQGAAASTPPPATPQTPINYMGGRPRELVELVGWAQSHAGFVPIYQEMAGSPAALGLSQSGQHPSEGTKSGSPMRYGANHAGCWTSTQTGWVRSAVGQSRAARGLKWIGRPTGYMAGAGPAAVFHTFHAFHPTALAWAQQAAQQAAARIRVQ
jgi:hypothetical protein